MIGGLATLLVASMIGCGGGGGESDGTITTTQPPDNANAGDVPTSGVAVAKALEEAGVDFAYPVTPTGSHGASTAFNDADVSIYVYDSPSANRDKDLEGLVPGDASNPAAIYDENCGEIHVRVGTGDSANPAKNNAVVKARGTQLHSALQKVYGPC